ncbi:hypothetical protein DSL64_04300 [Dyadobacter luteus]|jgi:hypothetical protein|uniref:Glycoside hydrolase family 5 domain-containing protein n=2 Tax=Dyadobacter luteus TaxID=2259619 RepID=A0A3D8YGH8_9BACT|nr:hypothetical protein DSL64_04300 [Dyadobacter luteus]
MQPIDLIIQSDSQSSMPWIKVCENSPYFKTENNKSWTPVGQNDAITWPDFQSLFGRHDFSHTERHMAFLAKHGVTCIRMMMEYCQTQHRYLENPVGRFQPNMVRFWDDMFALCEKYSIRLLITPFDTFWMARRWRYHPYNKRLGGPCASKYQWLSSPDMIAASKNRFTFFIERWGGSGVLFGWDLWNEIDPKHAGKDLLLLNNYICEISIHIRQTEMRLYHKSHLQTVSVFAPTLQAHQMTDVIFKHPLLDFASIHMYQKSSIDYPSNAYAAACATAEIVKASILDIEDNRPFLDSEHGPITYFSKNKKGLAETFDDKYFLYMQWAHLSSGAAGGGMRWPYRHPHTLTHGMRRAQLNMARFTELIDWKHFKRRAINSQIKSSKTINVLGCADANQAVLWLVSPENCKGKERQDAVVIFELSVYGLSPGNYQIHFWDTQTGHLEMICKTIADENLEIDYKLSDNVAIAISRV